ncbi:MAG: RNA-directed DNA polymerase [Candidatus Kerfeldbacteria bacterium]|nr:RNA-directed DNA polymerase [Candidatus Kerfeldbacteria bacterium]
MGGFDYASSLRLDGLAAALGVTVSFLEKLQIYPGAYYDDFAKKKDGGLRKIVKVDWPVRRLQERLHHNVFGKIKLPDFVECQSGRSSIDHALRHKNQTQIITFDIESYFPSITYRRVRQTLAFFGFNQLVSAVIARITIRDGSLPQGTPTSTDIANFVGTFLDRRLLGLCEKHNWVYSRYVDDVAISGFKNMGWAKKLINKIIISEGFRISTKQGGLSVTMVKDVPLVTGVRINKTFIQAPKEYYRSVRQKIYLWQKFGYESAYPGFSKKQSISKLHGKVHYLMYLDKVSKRFNGQGYQLFKQFQKLHKDPA